MFVRNLIITILLCSVVSSYCFACSNKLYKMTVLQGFLIEEVKDFDREPKQEINILIKADCPGEMIIKAEVKQEVSSKIFNKSEKVLLKAKKIGLVDSGVIDYKSFKGKILSIKGKELSDGVLRGDKSYKNSVKRAFIKAKNFAFYPLDCYFFTKTFSNSPASPLLLLMEPFYFVLGIVPALFSPVSAIFQEGEKIHLKRKDMVELEILENISL